MSRKTLGCLVLLLFCGCTHQQLRFNTTHYARTAADINTQQVLDNLAKFSSNPYALPHLTYSSAGQSSVTDTMGSGATFNFSPKALASWTSPFSGNRANLESLTVATITDPRKLELMRCAYQRVVCGHCLCENTGGCPNCERRFNEFYLGTTIPGKRARQTYEGKPVYALLKSPGDPSGQEIYKDTNEFNEDFFYYVVDGTRVPSELIQDAQCNQLFKPLYDDDSVKALTQRTGKITVECLGSCWFKVGRKCDVPRKSECTLVGCYCDTYIWVPPSGRDELTKLTLVILDIALNNSAVLPSIPAQEVVTLYNNDGEVAHKIDEGVTKVTKVVSGDAKIQPPKGLSKLNCPANANTTDQKPGNTHVHIESHTMRSTADPVNLRTSNQAYELLNNNLMYQSLTPQRQ